MFAFRLDQNRFHVFSIAYGEYFSHKGAEAQRKDFQRKALQLSRPEAGGGTASLSST